MDITEAQNTALHRVYNRTPLVAVETSIHGYTTIMATNAEKYKGILPEISFDAFKELTRMSGDTVMVPWCGMWLGIEPDGYTHS